MQTIHAVFENGVFRPTEPVELPEKSRVTFEPKLIQEEPFVEDEAFVEAKIDEIRQSDPALAAVYEILSRRYGGNEPGDILETHNDHQP